MIFDIKEFAVYDGPGVRTTVFMKGCPLRCKWCHNPEGLEKKRQLMVSTAACKHCGACKTVCEHETCVACGNCISMCKGGLRRLCGEEIAPEELAKRISRDKNLWEQTGGGVTFSGGEPLLQWEFVKETLGHLPGVHALIETSGFAPAEIFSDAVDTLSMVIMDLKHMDSAAHEHWTGQKNERILANAKVLLESDTPCVIRVPLIPGVNDSAENLRATAEFVQGAKNLLRVELLPYHKTAGAKYEMAGMTYAPDFDTDQAPNADKTYFEELGVPVIVL